MLTKKEQRLRRSRQTRIRIATQGVARLTVNRTNSHIYASVISGCGTKVLATASTAQETVRALLGAAGKAGDVDAAKVVGKEKYTIIYFQDWHLVRSLMRHKKI